MCWEMKNVYTKKDKLLSHFCKLPGRRFFCRQRSGTPRLPAKRCKKLIYIYISAGFWPHLEHVEDVRQVEPALGRALGESGWTFCLFTEYVIQIFFFYFILIFLHFSVKFFSFAFLKTCTVLYRNISYCTVLYKGTESVQTK